MSPRDRTQLQVRLGEGWLSALLCPHLQELHLEAESLVVSLPLLPRFLLPSALTTSSPSSIAGLTWHKSISVVRETVITCNVCIAFLLIRSCWSGSAKAVWNSPLTLPFLEQDWDPARLGLHGSFLVGCISVSFKKFDAPCSAWSLLLTWLCCTDTGSEGREQCSKEAGPMPLSEAHPVLASHTSRRLSCWVQGMSVIGCHWQFYQRIENPPLVRNQIKKTSLGNNEKGSLSFIFKRLFDVDCFQSLLLLFHVWVFLVVRHVRS